MFKRITATSVVIMFFFVFTLSCASSPEKIKASYVSPYQYENMSCNQIEEEIKRVESQLSRTEASQKKKATTDAVGMAVGMVVFWPALFLLAAGDDQKEELSRLKGEYEALQRIHKEKCEGVQKREIEHKQITM